eukprot:COSAG01_NODE_6344_length_3723_cov_68.518212_8_plen_80_part_00
MGRSPDSCRRRRSKHSDLSISMNFMATMCAVTVTHACCDWLCSCVHGSRDDAQRVLVRVPCPEGPSTLHTTGTWHRALD